MPDVWARGRAARRKGRPDVWGTWRVGDRVVVRYRRPAPEPGEPTLSDALGDLVQLDETGLTVRTRHGDVTIQATAVVAAKRVPPPPEPRRRPEPGR